MSDYDPAAIEAAQEEIRKRCYLCESIQNVEGGTFVGGDFLCRSCRSADQQRYERESVA